MIWIGGAQGAGKSTIAWQLSRTLDLPLHPIDMWGYDHNERLMPRDMTLDEELAAGPEAAADAFVATSHARLPLVVDDVRAQTTAPVPVLVEGPQLMPSMAAQLPIGHAVFLLPSQARTRAARVLRPDADPDRLERLVARDARIAERVRTEAAALDLPVIEVPAEPDWAAVHRAVHAALVSALTHRLAPGPDLTRQRAFENDTVARQVRLWAAAAGREVIPGSNVPPFPWACECGTSGCSDRSPLGTLPPRPAR